MASGIIDVLYRFFSSAEGETRHKKLMWFLSCRPCFPPQITWERRRTGCYYHIFFSVFLFHRHLIYFYQKTHRRRWNITTGPFKVSGGRKWKTILPPNHKAWVISWIQYETGLCVIVHLCEMKGEKLCATLPHLNYNMKMIGGRIGDFQKGKEGFLCWMDQSHFSFFFFFFF